MKKILILFVAFTCLLLNVTAQTMDKPVARVYLTKTEVITQTMVKHRMQELQQMGAQATNKDVVELMISEILVSQAAERDKVTVTEAEILNQYKQQSEQAGKPVTLEEVKQAIMAQTGGNYTAYIEQAIKQLLNQKYITTKKQEMLQNISTPTEKEIVDFFEENSLQFTNPEIIEFNHITYSIQEKSESDKKILLSEAQKLAIDIANNTTSIEDLVFKAQMTGSANYVGETKAHLAKDDKNKMMVFGKSFFDAVFDLNKGQVSGVIQSNVGYHIIQINQKYKKKFLELSDPLSPENPTTVKEYIRFGLFNQKQQTAFQQAALEVTRELREEAEVKIFEANLEF